MLPQVKPIVRRVESLKIETALIDSVRRSLRRGNGWRLCTRLMNLAGSPFGSLSACSSSQSSFRPWTEPSTF